jgi:hypothetical protein
MYQQGYNQDYSTGMNMWQQEINRNQMPWGMLPGMLGGTYSTPVVNQGQTNPWPGMALGAAGGVIGGIYGGPMGAAAGYGVGSGVGNAASSQM